MVIIIKKFYSIYRPEIYQGYNKKNKYFEGWYFKIIDEKEIYKYSVIPGISLGDTVNSRHAFVQVLNGVNKKTYNFKYPFQEFVYSKREFNIAIGENHFSTKSINLNLKDDNIIIKGELKFQNIIPWPKDILSPGAMGWYSFAPFMECYHGIISLNHSIQGYLDIDGDEIDFTGGKGYTEKDWGKSFPKSWIWLQSNHFNEPDTSLTLSVAEVPWLSGSFVGFIAGLWYKNKLYKFATYTGSKICKINYADDDVSIIFQNKINRLKVTVDKREGGELLSPIQGNMDGRINESILSNVHVSLYDTKGLIFSEEGRNTGLEIVGRLENI